MEFWTIERIDTLMAMEAKGKTFSEIAAHLGCSRSSAIGKHHRVMVKRGHVPVQRKRILEGIGGEKIFPELLRHTTPKRVYTRSSEPKVSTQGIGFILPAAPPAVTQRGPAVGILDVTGCKWPVAEDASVIGGQAFCDCARKDGSPYCAEHAARAVDKTAKPLTRSIGALGLRFEKRAA